MNTEVFLTELLLVSMLTGLVTEALKSLLTERGKEYRANALAGCVSAALSGAISIGYAVLTETTWSGKMTVYLTALIFLSWLSAMVGYDKVIQLISQFTAQSAG